MKPTITICTDASFSPDYGIATWACYIRTQGLLIKTAGVLKEPVMNVNLAERLAMANALHLAARNVNLSNLRVVIYSDNEAALSMPGAGTMSGLKSRRSQARRMQSLYDTHIVKVLRTAASYEFRHVKAHVAREQWTGPRNYMNDFCDRAAKGLLRQTIGEAERMHDEIDAEMYERIAREP